MAGFTNTALQEIFRPPTRISTLDLMKRYVLPSALSRYETLTIPSSLSSSSADTHNDSKNKMKLGVHYLCYDNPKTKSPTAATDIDADTVDVDVVGNINVNNNANEDAQHKQRFGAIYVNHGFGASSLSWLPVLPLMVNRLGAKKGLGHDAIGFGFTDRPLTNQPTLDLYTTDGSANIGTTLLQRALLEEGDTNFDEKGNQERLVDDNSLILMGHSMGARTTLKMALSMPKTTPKWIVLVAPALGVGPGNNKSLSSPSQGLMSFFSKIKARFLQVGSIAGQYTLRRIVGYVFGL